MVSKMKSVLISIQPKWVEKIANGQKTIEVRKTAPKCGVPFKCYIYATKKARLQTIFKKGEWIFSDDHSFGKFDENIFVKDSLCAWQGKVIGEFICDKVDKYTFSHYEAEYRVTHVEQNAMCLNHPELIHYGKGKTLYGWHISDLKIYDKPKELSEFKRPLDMPTCGYTECGSYETPYCKWLNMGCEKRIITRPPQSWQYVEEL